MVSVYLHASGLLFIRDYFQENVGVQVCVGVRSQTCFYCSHRSSETCFHEQVLQEGYWVHQIHIRTESAFQELTYCSTEGKKGTNCFSDTNSSRL